MPRGKPSHVYQVKIGPAIYHKGDRLRAAMQAFSRAQRGNKGIPAPCRGRLMVFLKDGRSVRGVDASGIHFAL